MQENSKNNLRAIFYVSVGFALYSIMDALVKFLSGEFSLAQIVFCNSFFAMIPILALSWHQDRFKALRTGRIGFHLLRGSIVTGAVFAAFYGYAHLPLSDAYAIAFSSPLFIAVFSIFFLKESVYKRDWAAILIGFLGVLIMLKPEGDVFVYAAFAPLLTAFLMALAVIIVRKIGATESPVTIAFYSTIVGMAVSGFLLLLGLYFPEFSFMRISLPEGIDWLFVILIGILAGCADIFLFAGFSKAKAALLAPFQYTQMLWAILFGMFFFGDWPDLDLFVGGGIVIISGAYIILKEMREKKSIIEKMAEADITSL